MDEIAKEKQRIADRLAKLDSERTKLAEQLSELEVAERVLARFGKGEPGERRRRGRPARAATAAAAAKAPAKLPRGARRALQAQGVSLSDAALKLVRAHPEGCTAGEILQQIDREFGLKARPNHLGIALQRHRRAGRLEQRDQRWYPPHSSGSEAAAVTS